MRDPLKAMHTLISESEIHARVMALADEIRRDHPHDLHLVCILKGGFIFLADLVRRLPGTVTLDFIAISSYQDGETSSGSVTLLKDLDTSIEGRQVVIVEDIVDSGTTLASLLALLRTRRPQSLRTACLLSKSARRVVDVPLDYVGFEIDDHFVVGYGLDLADRYRNLPYIATREKSGQVP